MVNRFNLMLVGLLLTGCSSGDVYDPENVRTNDCQNLDDSFTEITYELERARDEQGFLGSVVASRMTPSGRKIRKLELQQELLRKEMQSSCSLTT